MNTQLLRKAVLSVAFFATVSMNAAVMAGQPGDLPSTVSGPGASALISETKASEIALGQSGGGQVVGMELKRRKHGDPVYAVLVVDGGSRIEVRVDATSGAVVKFERKSIERVEYPDRRQGGRVWPETAVTSDKAREIALERTGGGTVVEVEKDFKKDGRILYEVEVIDAGRKCEIEIDAQTGRVTEYQEKSSRF